jgi:hemerythrin superfamily protein
VSTPTGRWDLVDVLVDDHHEVEQLFTELEKDQAEPKLRGRVTAVVIAELVRHSVAEEIYLYPTVRRALPDGDALADKEIGDHADAERMMKELEDLEPADQRFEIVLNGLMAEVRDHIREEEQDLFPRLRSACSADELAELGAKVEAAKKIAPTRPHPSAPDRPPWNMVLGPATGLVDRVRDVLTRRPTSPEDLRRSER